MKLGIFMSEIFLKSFGKKCLPKHKKKKKSSNNNQTKSCKMSKWYMLY